MTIASFSYLLRTPDGKVAISTEELQQPLHIAARDRHSSLTMTDYFESLQQLVLTHYDSLPKPLHAEKNAPVHCLISSEKLGAFYHVAKVEIQTGGKKISLAVNTAISDIGKRCLEEDHLLLSSGLPPAMRPFVPKIFLYTGSEDIEKSPPFHHMVVEWLEDFFEWHLCSTDHEPRFSLWTDNGSLRLGEGESRFLFRTIAHIITLSYDWHQGTFLQRWHHAAGDFIARHDNTPNLSVRMITMRALEPFPFLTGHGQQLKFSSLLLFLVDLSIRMRLDKLDGVGKTVWLDDFVVEETIRGFFFGLAEQRPQMGEDYEMLLHLLSRFTPEDLGQLSTPLFPFYEERLSEPDLIEVKNNFACHITHLSTCLTDQVQEKLGVS